MTTLKFTKVEAGWYATEDGRYAVVTDGYHGYISAHARETFGTEHEWAAAFDPAGGLRVDHQVGETLEWFSTKREAVEFLQERAR